MKKLRWCSVGIYLVIVLGVVWALPSYRAVVQGVFLREPFHDGKPLRYWLEELQHPETRAEGIEALAQMGPDILPQLRAALKDRSAPRQEIAEVIGRMGKPAMPDLIELLKDR